LTRSPFLQPLALFRHGFIGFIASYVLASATVGGSSAAWGAFAFLAAVWCLPGWLLRGRLAQTWSRAVAGYEWAGFNLALTAFLAEVSLRVFAACSGDSLLLSDSLEAYRLVPGRDYGHGLRGNALGYPGPDFQPERRPGVLRIAALGDSFAVGPAVPFADNFLCLVEKALPHTEVYNFGVSGAGPREYHAVLRQHVWAVQPDLVLVCVFVGNDITESLATPHHLDPRQHALYLLLTRGSRLLRERWRQPGRPSADPTDRLAHSGLSEQAFDEVEARRLAVCLKTPPPDLEKKWQRALGHLGRLIADCRAHRTPVAFVLIPDEFQVHPQVLTRALQTASLDRAAVDLELPQRRLVAFFAEQEVACLDLRPAFDNVADTHAPRDTHWNSRGNHLAAEKISCFLRTSMLPRCSAAGLIQPDP
jgi:hypothetical protein